MAKRNHLTVVHRKETWLHQCNKASWVHLTELVSVFSFSLPHVTNYNSCFTATLKGHTTLECSLVITRSWCLWWPSQCYYSQGSSDGRWHQSSAQYSQIATFSFWFGLISVCSVAPLANRNPCFICERKKWLLSVLIKIAFSNRILKRAVMFPCLVYWPRDTRFQMC